MNIQGLPCSFGANLGNQTLSERTVVNGFHEFQRANFNVEDAAPSGRPRTTVSQQTIDTVQAIVKNDPHSTYE
ncbi:unnamed protein product [Rotaria sp. Silwood2]|nr:unnamed protein product [Rotaria sp. Silwood2]CAF4308604.1 unnamed protein product [Rotaria sp. Silwood2]